MPTPTVRRLQLGNELRRVREESGKTPTEAAKIIDYNPSKISRMELGQSSISIGDLKLLLEFYGDDSQHIAWMLDLARDNRARGRWSGYRSVFPAWFRMYVDLEQDAEDIRHVGSEIVPGLLQTEAYIRAMHPASQSAGESDNLDNRVQAHKERQRIITKDNPPELSFVLSESCLRRMVGDASVMRDQLKHLAGLAKLPNVQIQVLPFDAQAWAGIMAYRFTVLRIPAPGTSSPLDFVYTEDYEDARYLDDKDAVGTYVTLWSRLQAAALGPVESRKFIGAVAKQ